MGSDPNTTRGSFGGVKKVLESYMKHHSTRPYLEKYTALLWEGQVIRHCGIDMLKDCCSNRGFC